MQYPTALPFDDKRAFCNWASSNASICNSEYDYVSNYPVVTDDKKDYKNSGLQVFSADEYINELDSGILQQPQALRFAGSSSKKVSSTKAVPESDYFSRFYLHLTHKLAFCAVFCYYYANKDLKLKDMEVYEFETTVLENGIIQIPEFYRFQNRRVRISIETVNETKTELAKKKKILNDFFEKWGSFFSTTEEDFDDDRYNYLMEKYK